MDYETGESQEGGDCSPSEHDSQMTQMHNSQIGNAVQRETGGTHMMYGDSSSNRVGADNGNGELTQIKKKSAVQGPESS